MIFILEHAKNNVVHELAELAPLAYLSVNGILHIRQHCPAKLAPLAYLSVNGILHIRDALPIYSVPYTVR